MRKSKNESWHLSHLIKLYVSLIPHTRVFHRVWIKIWGEVKLSSWHRPGPRKVQELICAGSRPTPGRQFYVRDGYRRNMVSLSLRLRPAVSIFLKSARSCETCRCLIRIRKSPGISACEIAVSSEIRPRTKRW